MSFEDYETCFSCYKNPVRYCITCQGTRWTHVYKCYICTKLGEPVNVCKSHFPSKCPRKIEFYAKEQKKEVLQELLWNVLPVEDYLWLPSLAKVTQAIPKNDEDDISALFW